MMDPLEAIARDPPNVWLTSFYGFAPWNWGFLGFTVDRMRDRFVRESEPGALVVAYAVSSGSLPRERDRIIGIQQMSHRTGDAREFMQPDAWREKQANPDRRNRWNLAVQAIRAWQITPESRMRVQDFAPVTFTPGRARVIGARGMPLAVSEAKRILDLDLVEVSVFGGAPVDQYIAGPARDVLKPSNPGPVSTTPYLVREAEGPKHLYILRLQANVDHLLGRDAEGRAVVKVGFSRSPETRRDDHNRALPVCAFSWTVERSTFGDGREPFPSSKHALAGEQAMKGALEQYGESLGGEFFLADNYHVECAWKRGIHAAENWKAA